MKGEEQVPELPRWRRLLEQSAPTRREAPLPFGLATRWAAQLAAQRRQETLLERLGLRALGLALAGVAALGLLLCYEPSPLHNLEPGVDEVVGAETLSLS